ADPPRAQARPLGQRLLREARCDPIALEQRPKGGARRRNHAVLALALLSHRRGLWRHSAAPAAMIAHAAAVSPHSWTAWVTTWASMWSGHGQRSRGGADWGAGQPIWKGEDHAQQAGRHWHTRGRPGTRAGDSRTHRSVDHAPGGEDYPPVRPFRQGFRPRPRRPWAK